MENSLVHYSMRTVRNFLVILTFYFFVTGCNPPHEKNHFLKTKIQEYLNNPRLNNDFSGVVLIGNQKQVLVEYVANFSDFKRQVSHTAESRFGIASLTKTFTAASILKLKNDGKLRFEDTISAFLPDFPHGEITILNLLRHESGLTDLDELQFEGKTLNSDELIAEIGKLPLQFKPGEGSKYSNAGYSLLAKIVETISQRSFEDFLSETFFDDLSMQNTGDLRELKQNEAVSKRYFPNNPPELVRELQNINTSLSLGSGSLYSSARDLWKWGNFIIQRKQLDIFAERYPYGWGRDSVAGHFSVNQTGMHEGYVSSLFIFPNEEIIIVFLSNIENGLWVDWSKDIARMYFEENPELNVQPIRTITGPTIPDTVLQKLSGTYQVSKERYVEIRPKNGNLFLHLNGYYKGHYLAPVSEFDFELRSFTGSIHFANDASRLTWKLPAAWGGGEEVYHRQTIN